MACILSWVAMSVFKAIVGQLHLLRWGRRGWPLLSTDIDTWPRRHGMVDGPIQAKIEVTSNVAVRLSYSKYLHRFNPSRKLNPQMYARILRL